MPVPARFQYLGTLGACNVCISSMLATMKQTFYLGIDNSLLAGARLNVPGLKLNTSSPMNTAVPYVTSLFLSNAVIAF